MLRQQVIGLCRAEATLARPETLEQDGVATIRGFAERIVTTFDQAADASIQERWPLTYERLVQTCVDAYRDWRKHVRGDRGG